MRTAPKHLQTVTDAQAAAASLPSPDQCADLAALGPLLRSLVASITQGLVLELEGGHGLLTAWLQDGLHYDIPLVVIDPDAPRLARCEANLYPDLRLAFHAQGGQTFLEDMSDKRFALIVDHREHRDLASLTLAVDRLEVGGMLVTRLSPELQGALQNQRQQDLARLRWSALPGGWQLAVMGPQIPSRRGGRASRILGREPRSADTPSSLEAAIEQALPAS